MPWKKPWLKAWQMAGWGVKRYICYYQSWHNHSILQLVDGGSQIPALAFVINSSWHKHIKFSVTGSNNRWYVKKLSSIFHSCQTIPASIFGNCRSITWVAWSQCGEAFPLLWEPSCTDQSSTLSLYCQLASPRKSESSDQLLSASKSWRGIKFKSQNHMLAAVFQPARWSLGREVFLSEDTSRWKRRAATINVSSVKTFWLMHRNHVFMLKF